jgi:hypothetical protein
MGLIGVHVIAISNFITLRKARGWKVLRMGENDMLPLSKAPNSTPISQE